MKKEKTLMIIAASLMIPTTLLMGLIAVILLIDDGFEVPTIIFSMIALIDLSMVVTLFTVAGNENQMIERKGYILTFAILSILQNIPVAVLLFIVNDSLGSYNKNMNALSNAPNNTPKNVKKEEVVIKEQISPEKRKIDILAKLGVSLVVLAGFILSTSYNNIFSSDISKPILMIVLFMIFRVLYRLFDTKVEIESSSKLYYILSYVFFVLIFVSISYFGIISDSLSFFGSYSDLMFSIVVLSLAYSLICIRNKYDYKVMGEFSFGLVLVAIALVLAQFEFELMQAVGIFLVISLFIYLNKEKLKQCILNVNDILFAFLMLLFIVLYIDSYEVIIMELLIGIFVIALIRQRIVMNDRFGFLYRYLLPIYTNGYIALTIIHAANACSIDSTSSLFITPTIFNFRMIIITIMLISGYLFLRSKDKETIHAGLFSSVIISFITTLTMLSFEYSMVSVLASIIIFAFVTVILKMAQKEIIKKFCFVSQFISLFLLSVSGVMFYINNGIDTSYDTIISVFIVFVMILHKFQSKIFDEYKLRKFIYDSTIISLLVLSSVFISSHNIVYNLIMLTILFVYRRFVNVYEKREHVYDFLFLLCVFLNLSFVLLSYTSLLITNLILLVALLIASYYFSKEKYIPYLGLCLSYVPLLYILNELSLDFEIFTILTRLPLIMLTFVITRKLLSCTIKSANIVEIILLSVIFLSYIFNVELALGLFTFIFALVMIFIGFKNEKYNSLFVVGIGATILNIIVQLADFWASVPLPVYLLFSGLLIIGYVTYKEINKNNVKEERKKEKTFEEKVDTSDNGINVVLLIIILASVGINAYNIYKAEEIRELKLSELKLIEQGVNVNDFYFDKDSNHIYILEGKHYSVDSLIKVYDKDAGKYNYRYYYVSYVSESELNRIRNSSDSSYGYYDSGYLDGTSKTFSYHTDFAKEFTVQGVKFNVKNDIINYLEEDYRNKYNYYYDYNNNYSSKNGNSTLDLIYNIYDVDNLEVYISNVEGKTVYVTTSNDVKIITKPGLYTFKDAEGKVAFVVDDNKSMEYFDYNDYSTAN